MSINDTEKDFQQKLRGIFQKMGIPEDPTEDFYGGIRYDFCYGLRMQFPASLVPKKYRLKIADLDTGLIMADEVVESGEYFVAKWRYFLRYGIEITLPDGKVVNTEFDGFGKKIVINIPVRTMGDSIAWFACMDAFRQKHGCDLYICMPEYVAELFRQEYPEIHFITDAERRQMKPYAVYTMGIWMDDAEHCNSPADYRQCSLHHYGAHILGMDIRDADTPPRVTMAKLAEPVTEPYVCISSYGSGLCKNWMNPNGWPKVVKLLKEKKYRVLDIDRQQTYGSGIHYTHIPREAEDFTGDFSLSQRAALISGAEFFIGLPSGLSWLAWCCGVPVVLISGFSLPETEFYTPYRVINRHVCHGCYADTSVRFVPEEFDWCPRHKNTSRHYECTRGITAEMVINEIRKITTI